MIQYYLLPNFTALKLSNQSWKSTNIYKGYTYFWTDTYIFSYRVSMMKSFEMNNA